MSYGCGNYMYRGDPGFFGNLFKGVVGTIGGAIGGFIKGGPVGAIVGAASGAGHATASNIGSTTLHAGDDPSGDARRMAAIHRQHAATIARAGTGLHPGAVTKRLGGGGGGGGEGRVYRRMRWTNTKALGRAERRIHAAVKHMTKYIRWVHPARAGHAAPKFKHSKRR